MRKFIGTGLLAMACVVLLTGCPPGPILTLSGTDAGLVGIWTGTVTTPGVSTRNVTVTFTIDEFNIVEVVDGAEPTVIQGIYAVDTSKSPDQIDLGVTNTSTNVSDLRKEVMRGVYERIGDDLDMSYVIKSFLDRPLSIESGERIYDLTRAQ